MGEHNSHRWMNSLSSELGERLDWCHPTVSRALGSLTTISHRPYHCCADNCRSVWSWCVLTDVTYHQLQVQSKHLSFMHVFIHHPLSQVSSSNHHHHKKTSALGRFGSVWQHHLSNPQHSWQLGTWQKLKGILFHEASPVCFEKPPPVTAPNVRLCVCGVGCVCVCVVGGDVTVWAGSEAPSY